MKYLTLEEAAMLELERITYECNLSHKAIVELCTLFHQVIIDKKIPFNQTQETTS